MNLEGAIELVSKGRRIRAGVNDSFTPVHAGAHAHFIKIGYMHTGNKNRGGVMISHYFKRARDGNKRDVQVQADGTYVKISRTAKGSFRRRGKVG